MELRHGPPVTGDNFYPRPALIAKLLRALRRGNVAFLGPRRTGKTSCLEAIRSKPEEFVPLYLNLEKFVRVESWFEAMVLELRTALGKEAPGLQRVQQRVAPFLSRLQSIDLKYVGIQIDRSKSPAECLWRKPAEDFLTLLRGSPVPILFLLDEFPTFLKLVAERTSREEAESVLNWFRAARSELKDQQVRFLVTGSIGLKGVVRKLRLAPTVNEFDTHEIPPLTDSEALGLLDKLARSHEIPLSLAGRKTMLRLLGANWPILLQLFVAELQDAAFPRSPTRQQLESLYRERLVHGSRNQYCDGMFDRLPDIFSPSECRLAREILRRTSLAVDGLTRSDFETLHEHLVPEPSHRALLFDELEHVLDTLKHDGYLLQRTTPDSRTVFASHILRDFWRRKCAA